MARAVRYGASGARIGARRHRPVNGPGRKHSGLVWGALGILVVLGAWEGAALLRMTSTLLFPSPAQTIQALVAYGRSPTFIVDLEASASEFGVGFGLAVVVGLPLGIAMGWFRRWRYALDPFVTFLYSIPRFALVPLMLVWFGIGIWSKVAVVFLGAVFAVLITVMEGVRNLDSTYVDCARSFGASERTILLTVGLPSSVPHILSGLRLGIARGLVGVVVGELVAAQHGLGLELNTAGLTYQTPTVFAILLVFAAAGVGLNLLVGVLERRFRSWAVVA